MTKKPSLKFRLIAYPLVAIFFAIAAYFIAISAIGYDFHYQNGKITKEKTGAIILSSRPGDAQVFIDGKKNANNTPLFPFLTIQVSPLKQGDYKVTIQKTGYETWNGALKVYAGMVSWGTQILLLPTNRTASAYNLSPTIQTVIYSPDHARELVATTDEANLAVTVYQINVTNKSKETLFEKRIVAGETYKPLIYSNDNQRILFEHNLAEQKSYVVFEANPNGNSWNVTDTFKTSFDSYVFSPKNREDLYASRAGDMFKLSYVSKKMSGVLASDVRGMYQETNGLTYIAKNDKYFSLYRLDANDKKALVIRDLPEAQTYLADFLSTDLGYAIVPASTKELLVYDIRGNVDAKPKKIADSVDYILLSPKSQFLGYGRAKGFYTYELDKDRTYTTFENRNISSINWFNDQFNLAYIENGQLKMVAYNGSYDKKIFDAANEYPVVTSPDGPRLLYVAENKTKKISDLFVFDFNS
jgi:hypothetical protein